MITKLIYLWVCKVLDCLCQSLALDQLCVDADYLFPIIFVVMEKTILYLVCIICVL